MDGDSSNVQEILSLQGFIHDMEMELHAVGVDMVDDEFVDTLSSAESSARKETVKAFMEDMEAELGVVNGDYGAALSPPVATCDSLPHSSNKTGKDASATPVTPLRRQKLSRSHLRFIQGIESQLARDEEAEEAMAGVEVSSRYAELREYLTSPEVDRDAQGGSGGSDSVYSLKVNSDAKSGVDAFLDSLQVTNLDLQYDSPHRKTHKRMAASSSSTTPLAADLRLKNSLQQSQEFQSPTRVSSSVKPTKSADMSTSPEGAPSLGGNGQEGSARGKPPVRTSPGVGDSSIRSGTNSNANTIYGNVTPLTVKMLGDERINNDYDDWHSGPKMEADGIARAYSGLYGTVLTSTGNYVIVHGLEIVLRPDVSLVNHILPALQRAADASRLSCEVCQSSHVLLEPKGARDNSPKENVLVAGSTKEKETAVSKEHETEVPSSGVHNLEWDCIDIQVCVSRSLKHRVLLCQFFKKLSPFVAPPVISTEPKEKGSFAAYEHKPHTFQFLKILRRMFTLSALSLSCLYVLPVEELASPSESATNGEHVKNATVINGVSLDFHYVSQLEGMCREDMWKYLREAGKVLEESYKQSENDCATLLTALQPIYKQHDVQLPVPPPRVKLADIPMNTALKVDADNAGDEVTPSCPDKPAVLDDSMTVITLLLKELWGTQKKRCDVEIKARLTQKNRHLVNASYSFTKYKGLLISTLATGPGKARAAKSSLNSSFVSTFMFTKITDFPTGASGGSRPSSTTGKSSQSSAPIGSAAVGKTPNKQISTSAGKVGRLGKSSGGAVSGSHSGGGGTGRNTAAAIGNWISSAAAFVAPLPPEKATSGGPGKETPAVSDHDEEQKTEDESVDIEIDVGSGVMVDNTPSLKPMFSLSSPPIVMYWCNCLVSTTPGSLYVTADHIYLSSGIMYQTKCAFPLVTVDNVTLDDSANVPTLRISLGGKRKILSVTPVGVDCSVLRTVLYDLLNYNTHDSKFKA